MRSLMKKLEPKKELLTSLFIVLWLGIAFFLFQNITFESNDDNSMARMAYGMIGDYETHLVFINVIIGKLLKLCLLLFPTVPWYTVFQCILVLISFFVITYLFLCRFGISKGLFPTFILIAFFGNQFFLQMQFSKTAGICCLAGGLLLFDAVKSNASGRIWKQILGILLMVAGSMYRFNVFGMILLILFGIGVATIWEPLKQKNWKEILRICFPFALVILLCLCFRGYDLWTYQSSPDWAAYREFNSLRAQLMDYGFPDYTANQALYESLNISSTDLEMFQSWNFADPEVFTTEAMRQLVDAKVQTPFSERLCLDTIRDFLLNNQYSAAVIIAVIVCMFTCKGKKSFFFLLYAIAAVIGIQVYLFINGRYGINRIDVSLVCSAFVLIVLYAWREFQFKERRMAAVLACAVFLSPFLQYDFLNWKSTSNPPVRFYELLATDKDNLYIRTVSTSVPRIPRASEIYPVGYQSNSCSLGGWGTYSVPYLTMWENYSVTNPFRDLVDNPDLYLVSTQSPNSCVQYIRNHYASEAEAYMVKISEDGYPIYRVSTTPGPVFDTNQVILGDDIEALHYGIAAAYANPEEETSAVYGYFYGDNMNSFASNIYLSITRADGEEELYYTRQSYSDMFGDYMNGSYANFVCTVPIVGKGDSVKLYLEVDDVIYCADIGAINQIVQSEDTVE